MIYDENIDIYSLPAGAGVPTATNLTPVSSHYCGELQVFASRYWQSVQAGSSVDRMVEIPERLENVTAAMFARFNGGIYSIEQVQYGHDSHGLDITTLSLKRYLSNLDIGGAI